MAATIGRQTHNPRGLGSKVGKSGRGALVGWVALERFCFFSFLGFWVFTLLFTQSDRILVIQGAARSVIREGEIGLTRKRPHRCAPGFTRRTFGGSPLLDRGELPLRLAAKPANTGWINRKGAQKKKISTKT